MEKTGQTTPPASTNSSCSDNKKLIYAVVEFTRNGTIYVSTCPLSWIKDETLSWPPKKGIERKAIINRMTPEKDWVIFKDVTTLGKYESYKEAVYYEKKRTATSSEDSCDDNSTNISKRNIKKNTKYRDNSISPPPFCENSSEDDSIDGPTEAENNVPLVEELHYVNMDQMIHDADITIVNDGNYNDILKLLTEMKIQQDIILNRLDHIEKMIASSNASNVRGCTIPNNVTLPTFPLNSVVELTEYDSQLKNEEAIQDCLINYLQFIGGSDAKSCIYRCLEKMFSNYLRQFCSWTGKGGNLKLNDLTLMQVIKKAGSS